MALMGRFPSRKSPGKQPIKKRGVKRFLMQFFPTRERENGLCRGFFSKKAIFPFSRGKNRISQGIENRGSLISVPLALREGGFLRKADFSSRAAKRGGFKRGVFPIWTRPSFFVLFVPFWDFPDFSGIFPDLLGDGPGEIPDLSFSSFSAY